MPESLSDSQSPNDGAKTREDFFREFLNVIRVPLVKSVAEVFFGNVRQVESLLHMPYVLFGFIEVDHTLLRELEKSVQEHWNRGVDFGSFLYAHYSPKPLNVVERTPDLFTNIEKRFKEMLSNTTYGPLLTSSMQVIYAAALSASWTAFECLATDLWVAALNEYPLPLAQAALGALDPSESGELTAKQISVGLAARYGFDLRNCLGTLLKQKFDFTNVSGIRKAYKIFIPFDDFASNLFSDGQLSNLEATRHLIVHRAGKIDEEYTKRTGSSLPIGSSLVFKEEETWTSVHTSHLAGIRLLAFVNDWILDHTK